MLAMTVWWMMDFPIRIVLAFSLLSVALGIFKVQQGLNQVSGIQWRKEIIAFLSLRWLWWWCVLKCCTKICDQSESRVFVKWLKSFCRAGAQGNPGWWKLPDKVGWTGRGQNIMCPSYIHIVKCTIHTYFLQFPLIICLQRFFLNYLFSKVFFKVSFSKGRPDGQQQDWHRGW